MADDWDPCLRVLCDRSHRPSESVQEALLGSSRTCTRCTEPGGRSDGRLPPVNLARCRMQSHPPYVGSGDEGFYTYCTVIKLVYITLQNSFEL